MVFYFAHASVSAWEGLGLMPREGKQSRSGKVAVLEPEELQNLFGELDDLYRAIAHRIKHMERNHDERSRPRLTVWPKSCLGLYAASHVLG